MKPNRAGTLLRLLLVVALVGCLLAPAIASAQTPPPEKRTVYVIGNLQATFSFPLIAYIIVDDDIFLADSWQAAYHELGPVGLAVDETNENLFVSYESFNMVEVFDARDATPLGTIPLYGTDDLAGMVVHQDRGQLIVVDRREKNVFVFDTTTFQQVDTWIIPTGNGIWGIDLMGDWLFCSQDTGGSLADPTNIIRYYDIDTHMEVGSITTTYPASAIAVTDYPEPLVFYQAHDGYAGMHPYFARHNMTTGVEDFLMVGSNPKGVTLNPATGYAYSVADNRVHVIDTNTSPMTITNSKNLNYTWVPTDTLATFIPFGGTVKKTCTSHPNGKIYKGDDVTFKIEIQNRHALAIDVLPLTDEYDSTQLTPVDANPPADDYNDDGSLDWSDLTTALGDLNTGDWATVTVTFTALEDCEGEIAGVNSANIHNVLDEQGNELPDASGQFDYTINCKCRTNLDCDNGEFCDGQETCNTQTGECVSPGNPCPLDDGLWCNGAETADCDEELDECGHENEPCPDDGEYCNGQEICNEDTDSCSNAGPPCVDDAQFCNGDESCDEEADECLHSGDPCSPGEECNEADDSCVAIDPGDNGDTPTPDPGDDEDLWPKGKVTGGCCGCD